MEVQQSRLDWAKMPIFRL